MRVRLTCRCENVFALFGQSVPVLFVELKSFYCERCLRLAQSYACSNCLEFTSRTTKKNLLKAPNRASNRVKTEIGNDGLVERTQKRQQSRTSRTVRWEISWSLFIAQSGILKCPFTRNSKENGDQSGIASDALPVQLRGRLY